MQTKLTHTFALAAVTQAVIIGLEHNMTMTKVPDNKHGPIHVPKFKGYHGRGHHHHPHHPHPAHQHLDEDEQIDTDEQVVEPVTEPVDESEDEPDNETEVEE